MCTNACTQTRAHIQSQHTHNIQSLTEHAYINIFSPDNDETQFKQFQFKASIGFSKQIFQVLQLNVIKIVYRSKINIANILAYFLGQYFTYNFIKYNLVLMGKMQIFRTGRCFTFEMSIQSLETSINMTCSCFKWYFKGR